MHNLKKRLANQSLKQQELINLKGGRGRVKSSSNSLTPTSSSPSSTSPTSSNLMPAEIENIINNYGIE